MLNNFYSDILFLDITHIFGCIALCTKVNLLSHFWTLYFKRQQSLELPSSTSGEIDVCAQWFFFCTEFNTQQLLFEVFLNITSVLDSVEVQSESIFTFLYIIIVQWWKSLEAPSSTPGGDRHMRSLAFLYGIQRSTTFT